LFQDVLSYEQYTWWQTYLDNPAAVFHGGEAIWYLDQLQRHAIAPVPLPVISEDAAGVIETLLTKERVCRDVSMISNPMQQILY
jgi:hypothetical protein